MNAQALIVTERGPGGRHAPIGSRLSDAIESAWKICPQKHYSQIAKEVGCSEAHAHNVIGKLRHAEFEAHALQVVKKLRPGELGAIAASKPSTYREMDYDRLRWLAKETRTKISVYTDRVRKGVNVVAASEFSRWVAFSGILDLVLDEDNHELRDMVAELTCLCNDYYRAQGTNPATEDQQIPAINRKLDVLIELMCRPVVKAA